MDTIDTQDKLIKPIAAGSHVQDQQRDVQRKQPQPTRDRKDDHAARTEKEGGTGKDVRSIGKISSEELLKEVQTNLEKLMVKIDVEIDEDSGEPIVKVLSRETGELIRQIPSEHHIKLHQKLEEFKGLLLDENA